jgi:hypothetical protein
MASKGVWIAYTQGGRVPSAIAPFSSELAALRYASDHTTADHVVKAVYCPFGVTVTEALEEPATPSPAPKPTPKPKPKPTQADGSKDA